MRIIGCDLHARQQSVAMLDTETGEVVNRTLLHEGNEVREFYSQLPQPVLVGIEAIGPMQWFLALLEELGIECQVGDATKIRAAEPRKQKHDRRDAELILKLLVEKRFPAIWRPSKEQLDVRALLLHRHHWVRLRTQVQNALQAIALANGLRRGPGLWSYDGQAKIAFLPLPPHASYRRSMLQALYRKMEEEISQLTAQVAEQAEQRTGARLLMTHPGVGPVTALATDVFLGDPQRFADGKALASYVGLIPREYSSGAHQRLGALTKQGSPFLRFLWNEAAAHAVRRDPDLQRFYRRKLVQKGLRKARVVAAYEQMYNLASDPFEQLRLLHVLRIFGGTNIGERMKTELDGLTPDQLKPGETQGRIRWALDELQKSDPKWVSEWATRKVLDKSNWFGAWRGLITQIPNEEREALYSRFAVELLDQAEQQRVVSVLVSVMDPTLAARVFERACEIRAELTLPPGHERAKWDHFRQLQDLLRAISPATVLSGISDKLEKDPVPLELDVLTDILPSSNLTKPDVRSSVTEDARAKVRAYLKRAAKIGADPEGLRASTRAHLAQLLANVGEREDLEDIRGLVAADSVRFEKVQAARMKGDRSLDSTGYGFVYLEAVTTVDPTQADDVIVELIRTQQYEYVLAQRLPLFARKSEGRQGFGTDRMDFNRIWKSRAGEPDDAFVEARRSRFADEIREQITRVKGEREVAADKRGFDYRLKILGSTLAALDGKRSAKLILELMELPGSWDGWTRVGALENLLVSGVLLRLEEVLKILEPTLQDILPHGHFSDDQSRWLFARYLCAMAFVDPPAAGIIKIRELLSTTECYRHDMVTVVAALGASQCNDAIDVLMELAGSDGKGAEAFGESWIQAIGALQSARSTEILLSFVEPGAQLFNREFIPDHRNGDLLARLLAERATKDKTLKNKLVELANGELPPMNRMLLAKVFGHFASEEDRVVGLCILRDDDSGIPYELFRSMEEAFLERRPLGPGSSAFTTVPRGSNELRKRLFEMAQKDAVRRRSAFALLGQIEVWRLEYGRPDEEPRHPMIESEVAWSLLLAGRD